jgi:hypothetical protein
MTMVCTTYIVFAPEGFTFDNLISVWIIDKFPNLNVFTVNYTICVGIAILVCTIFYVIFHKKVLKQSKLKE